MPFLGYITPAGRAALPKYVYHGEDKSYLYKYILSPWAAFCVETFTPRTAA
jgi:hypothetical protein